MKMMLRSTLAIGLVAAAAVRLAHGQQCGDVNASGSVTATDAQAVLKSAVGQPVELECGPLAQPLKTGDVSDYGPRSDGVTRIGIPRSFTDNGDGTITDNVTGLMWEKKDNAAGIHDKDDEYTWTAGNGDLNGTIITSFLASLNAGSGFAGHKDWRIPNRFELETLVDMGDDGPSAYGIFSTLCPTDCTVLGCSCTRAGNYWTSTTFFSEQTGAWAVGFSDGDTTALLKTTDQFARAVRDAN
jgi:hypothetical protein